MKTLIFLSILIPVIAVAEAKGPKKRAPASENIKCGLTGGDGPFQTFEIKNGELAFKFVKNLDGNPGGNVRLKAKKSETREIQFGFDIFEWGDGTIYLAGDDAGTAAFVAFVSDGPRVTGYYRCKTP